MHGPLIVTLCDLLLYVVDVTFIEVFRRKCVKRYSNQKGKEQVK